MEGLKPYKKVVTKNGFSVCAVYAPNPHTTGKWCWCVYDITGRLVGIQDKQPAGEVVEEFTGQNMHNAELAFRLNKENSRMVEAWHKGRMSDEP